MSNYQLPTKHPITGKWEVADWLDDYFNNFIYGVRFPSDDKIYRADKYNFETRDFTTGTSYISLADYKEPKYNWFQRLVRWAFKLK